ncbi:MAG: 3-dehydroquinate synthase [Xanthobacteraceae bacterium]
MSRATEKVAARANPITVPVPLGERGYDIVIGAGLIDAAGSRIARLRPGAAAAIVTDETVAKLHLPRLESALAAADIRASMIAVPAGEASKSYKTLERIVDAILDAKIERGDLVVAFGGGVVGDLAGFAAAVARRGVDFLQIPTTLLAQVDSSVGGKTGINTRHGKNLVGAFHQPALVLVDTDLLDTLPAREFRAGYAEVAKYGLIADAPFFARLEKDRGEVFAGGAARAEAIAISCRHKAAIVGRDERETGERALLNFGHTFGHALEAATGFSERLRHGEAIAIGMVLAFDFSSRRGLSPAEHTLRVAAHLKEAGLPTAIGDIPGKRLTAEALIEPIGQDKKVTRGKLNFILTRGIGQAFVATDVPRAEVIEFLAEKVAA